MLQLKDDAPQMFKNVVEWARQRRKLEEPAAPEPMTADGHSEGKVEEECLDDDVSLSLLSLMR
jgi:hypothetical protein